MFSILIQNMQINHRWTIQRYRDNIGKPDRQVTTWTAPTEQVITMRKPFGVIATKMLNNLAFLFRPFGVIATKMLNYLAFLFRPFSVIATKMLSKPNSAMIMSQLSLPHVHASSI
jgi:hypothetical protein